MSLLVGSQDLTLSFLRAPQWDAAEACRCVAEVEASLRGDGFREVVAGAHVVHRSAGPSASPAGIACDSSPTASRDCSIVARTGP